MELRKDGAGGGQVALRINQIDGGIGAGVLHGGKDAVLSQGRQRFGGPGDQKGLVGIFIIVGNGIGGIVPFGNHDRKRAAKRAVHYLACILQMGRPMVDIGEAGGLAPGVVAGVFVPADCIRERLRML